MDTRIVIGIIILFVVAFFGYQWWRHVSNKGRPSSMSAPFVNSSGSSSGSPSENPSGNSARNSGSPPKEMPIVAGQTEQELLTKEPLQERRLATQQEPVTHDGQAPADFESNIRHPEQSFHQPSVLNQQPKMSQHDVVQKSVESSEQGFSPEMAQNDGPLVGNVFAFDGMEPTGFATF